MEDTDGEFVAEIEDSSDESWKRIIQTDQAALTNAVIEVNSRVKQEMGKGERYPSPWLT